MQNLPRFGTYHGEECPGCGTKWHYLLQGEMGRITLAPGRNVHVTSTSNLDFVVKPPVHIELRCGNCGHVERVKTWKDSYHA